MAPRTEQQLRPLQPKRARWIPPAEAIGIRTGKKVRKPKAKTRVQQPPELPATRRYRQYRNNKLDKLPDELLLKIFAYVSCWAL
jgi:hypothetical protein